jgi:hypothetical protein
MMLRELGGGKQALKLSSGGGASALPEENSGGEINVPVVLISK